MNEIVFQTGPEVHCLHQNKGGSIHTFETEGPGTVGWW